MQNRNTSDHHKPHQGSSLTFFADEEFFISNTPSNLNAHKERGLQINEKTGYISQDAVLDLAPDEKVSAKKKPGVKWDRKKKRFIGYVAVAVKGSTIVPVAH